jgi:hypothetical protein
MKKSCFFLVCFFASRIFISAQTEEYIQKWVSVAIDQMLTNKIPASITLAQGILESNSGLSDLAIKANNHFGIKCHSNWTGATFYKDDDKKNECFRSYPSPKESFEDHSDFLKKDRYKELFNLEIVDYKGWANGLKKCGYATNPNYASLLINIIEKYKLNQWDSSRKKTTIITSRKVERKFNRIRFVIAKKGDSFESLSKELHISEKRLKKYNDVNESEPFPISPGLPVYIQPKRKKSRNFDHTKKTILIQEPCSLWQLSQSECIKLSSLCKLNKLTVNVPLTPGVIIRLK